MAVGRLDFGSGDVADIVLEMFIILSQLTWGDMDLPPMEKGTEGTPGPTREWGAETTEGDTTNEVVRGGWDDGKGGGREQGSDGGPVIIINYSIKPAIINYNYLLVIALNSGLTTYILKLPIIQIYVCFLITLLQRIG